MAKNPRGSTTSKFETAPEEATGAATETGSIGFIGGSGAMPPKSTSRTPDLIVHFTGTFDAR